MQSNEQRTHDRINLPRLVTRLERSVQETDWADADSSNRDCWIKAQGVLQGIKHAKILLKNVELDDTDLTPSSQQRYQRYRVTLEHLEGYMRKVERQTAPVPRRPKPLLPSIRPPVSRSANRRDVGSAESPSVEATLIPAEGYPSSSAVKVDDLIPTSVSETRTSESLPAPSARPSSLPLTSNINATPTILQNSRALQEELSEQLALMATQLRRNATHFSESLEKDKSVVETMQEKLEGNFEFMKAERIRLRDFRGKSGGTTCLVIMSIIVVLIAFIVMVFIIRLT